MYVNPILVAWCLKSKFKLNLNKNLHSIFKKNIKKKFSWNDNVAVRKDCKTWFVKISHIQRGFPIKEVYSIKNTNVNNLRNDIQKVCRSPKVQNIFSEIFIKSLNSLAFNLIALKYKKNNYNLSKNKKDKKDIINILNEGDYILQYNNIKVPQSPISRIKQTLSSNKHTMSMLNSVKIKKTELKLLGRF